MNRYGCLFLSLLSIAEERTGKKVDLIDAYHDSLKRGWIDGDMWCKDQCAILQHLTGEKWTREVVEPEKLPNPVPKDSFTVEKYVKKNGCTHFRRRYLDTIRNCNTVREGRLTAYYVYTAGRRA